LILPQGSSIPELSQSSDHNLSVAVIHNPRGSKEDAAPAK